MNKLAQFILLKSPPNLVRRLRKIHALSIEVLADINIALLGRKRSRNSYKLCMNAITQFVLRTKKLGSAGD